MKISGKRMVITGGTSGIGYALAERSAASGADVLICGRDGERVADVAARLGVHGTACDVGAEGQRPILLEAADEHLGGVDILVHNAGVQRELDLTGCVGDNDICRELEVNLAGPIRLTALAVPQLLAAASTSGAALVFVTSVLALAPKASAPVYCPSKAGLRSFAKVMRAQLGPLGVRVLEVMPPVVDTAMTAGRDETKIAPTVVAGAILEGIEKDRNEVLVGKARLAAGLLRLAPGLAERMISGT